MKNIFVSITIVMTILLSCNTKNKETNISSTAEVDKKEETKVASPSFSNLPYDIYFVPVSQPKTFEIISITATAKKNRGYALTIKAKGLSTVSSTSPSSALRFSLLQKDKDSVVAHSGASFFAPTFKKGEEFTFEIVNLYDGYFNPNKFEAFLVDY